MQNFKSAVRTGINTSVVEEYAETRDDKIVSTNIIQTMRSRDIVVTGENFKPNTRYYIFFDGINVGTHITPSSTTYGVGGVATKGTGLRSNNLGMYVNFNKYIKDLKDYDNNYKKIILKFDKGGIINLKLF